MAEQPPEENTPSEVPSTRGTPKSQAAEGFANLSTVEPPARIPAFESLAPTQAGEPSSSASAFPRPGDTLDDFEILRELGAGSFAKVFLARQISLDRQVALKVSDRCGTEARTLASLEHEHIVRVFSETVHPTSCFRILCLQSVPGTTLE